MKLDFSFCYLKGKEKTNKKRVRSRDRVWSSTYLFPMCQLWLEQEGKWTQSRFRNQVRGTCLLKLPQPPYAVHSSVNAGGWASQLYLFSFYFLLLDLKDKAPEEREGGGGIDWCAIGWQTPLRGAWDFIRVPLYMEGTPLRPQAICLCFLKHISQELNWKQNSQAHMDTVLWDPSVACTGGLTQSAPTQAPKWKPSSSKFPPVDEMLAPELNFR